MEIDKGLSEHLLNNYRGTYRDTKPLPLNTQDSVRKVIGGLISRLKPKNPVANFFGEIKEKVEQEKRELGDRLLEDFVISDLGENPSKREVLQNVLDYFNEKGYGMYGIVGDRSRLLKNSEGKMIYVTVNTGTKYLSVQIVRKEQLKM